MSSIFKLIRRFVIVLTMATLILVVLNLVLLFVFARNQIGNGSPWKTAEAVSAALTQEGEVYALSDEGRQLLEQAGAWAILVDDGSGQVVWSSDGLPAEVPLQYSVADLAWAIRGYIADYPTTAAEHGDNLLLLGHPKTALWKLMWNSFDYQLIANAPKMILIFLLANIAALLVIYLVVVSGILRPIRPLIRGIQALPEGQEVYVKERGLFSSLAKSVNRASEKLRTQEYELKKKDAARANWIAGISHDIRTPLSMVMGYAGQLEEDSSIPAEGRKKAGIIRLQSLRMKNLVNDLNFASKLEYNVQPLHRRQVNAVALAREIAVDFLNMDAEGLYPIDWATDENLAACMVDGDPDLLKRALSNLILNAQVHNPDGCTVTLAVKQAGGMCRITVADNGVGVTDPQLESLRNTPHYMFNDSGTGEQRHGLGLLIVRQIAQAHGGNVAFSHAPQGGFMVTISLPAVSTEFSSECWPTQP